MGKGVSGTTPSSSTSEDEEGEGADAARTALFRDDDKEGEVRELAEPRGRRCSRVRVAPSSSPSKDEGADAERLALFTGDDESGSRR